MLDWTWNSNKAFLQALQIGAGELKAGGKPVMDWHTSSVGKEILLKWSLAIDTRKHQLDVCRLRSSQLHHTVKIVTQFHIIQTNNVLQQ